MQRYDERNADLVYSVNGILRRRDEPGISPFDAVVQSGDAVWEGLRLYNGRIFALEAHLTRLRRSAAALGFGPAPSDAQIAAAIAATLHANGMADDVHIRLTLTRGVRPASGIEPRFAPRECTLIVIAEHTSPVYDAPRLRLATSNLRRPGPEVLDPRINHVNLLSAILAKMEVAGVGADDALMLDSRGLVAGTATTHLFAVIRKVLVTPRTIASPEGITRATVLDLAPRAGIDTEVRDISLTELYAADEVFCAGTAQEIAGVVQIDGRPIGDGEVGLMTRRVSLLYRAHASTRGTPVVAPASP